MGGRLQSLRDRAHTRRFIVYLLGAYLSWVGEYIECKSMMGIAIVLGESFKLRMEVCLVGVCVLWRRKEWWNRFREMFGYADWTGWINDLAMFHCIVCILRNAGCLVLNGVRS